MAWRSTVKAVWLLENNNQDDTENNNDALVYQTATYATDIVKSGSYSLVFSGAYAGVHMSPQNLMTAIKNDTVGYSWEFWVYDKYNVGNGSNRLSGRANISNFLGNSGYELHLDDSNVILVWNGKGYYLGNYSRTTERLSWIHLAVTYDIANSVLKVYKNGDLIYTLNSASNMFSDGSQGIMIGSDGFAPSNAYFDNIIFNVGLVPTVFPTTEVTGAKSIGTFGFPKSRFKRQRLGAI